MPWLELLEVFLGSSIGFSTCAVHFDSCGLSAVLDLLHIPRSHSKKPTLTGHFQFNVIEKLTRGYYKQHINE